MYVHLDGYSVFSRAFTAMSEWLDFLDEGATFQGNWVDDDDGQYNSLSFYFTATLSQPGQGFGFDYILASGPRVEPPPPPTVPLPAGLQLLLSALAGMWLALRRRGRRALA